MRRFSNVTTTQLARICGVSQGTVDRALHNRGEINPETKAKILAVAKEYGYVPSLQKTGAGQGRSMLIGVVLFDLYNEYFSRLAMSFVNQAKRAGYSVLFLFSNKKLKSEREAVEYFHYIGVDGIVLFSVGSDESGYAEYLRSVMKPIVLIGNRVGDLQYIGVDDFQAMYDLTARHEAEAGAGEIVYFAPVLAGKLSKNNAQILRHKGFVRAMENTGRAYRLVTELESLPQKAAGIVCSTDYYVLQVFQRTGGARGIALAGFDNISLLQSLEKRVLTVEYSTDTIALECLKYLLGKKYQSKIKHTIVENT